MPMNMEQEVKRLNGVIGKASIRIAELEQELKHWGEAHDEGKALRVAAEARATKAETTLERIARPIRNDTRLGDSYRSMFCGSSLGAVMESHWAIKDYIAQEKPSAPRILKSVDGKPPFEKAKIMPGPIRLEGDEYIQHWHTHCPCCGKPKE